ncbi:MAG: putative 7-carboxy-7-deazaguanine synthase QueE [Anaeromicrobium sp.]|nr:putative 7-carboxy-7-deazaguanine synthase QueE [Anaeromicrobium sp.]MCT4595298.1 putative 7-carboxy-7-deazaguanine synthase QueE [Anaeromicrobium sp.]
MMYKVVEHFISINGEGKKAGELALFIRFQGCNLTCSYCDTMWANKGHTKFTFMNKEEIYELIKESKVKNVTLTGGEPLLQDNMYELLEFISKDKSVNIEIETNGSVDISSFSKLDNTPSFTLDYKLPSSNMENLMNTNNYNQLKSSDVVKFVAGTRVDLDRAKEIIKKYDLTNRCHVYLSPSFEEITPGQIVDYMKQNRLNKVKLQLQMHKFIWDPEERGV